MCRRYLSSLASNFTVDVLIGRVNQVTANRVTNSLSYSKFEKIRKYPLEIHERFVDISLKKV